MENIFKPEDPRVVAASDRILAKGSAETLKDKIRRINYGDSRIQNTEKKDTNYILATINNILKGETIDFKCKVLRRISDIVQMEDVMSGLYDERMKNNITNLEIA